jgi:hypothetical protein
MTVRYSIYSILCSLPALLLGIVGIWVFWKAGTEFLPEHPVYSFLLRSVAVSFVVGMIFVTRITLWDIVHGPDKTVWKARKEEVPHN